MLVYMREWGGKVVDTQISPTIEAAMGMGGNNTPIICFDTHDLNFKSDKSDALLSGGKDKTRVQVISMTKGTNDG